MWQCRSESERKKITQRNTAQTASTRYQAPPFLHAGTTRPRPRPRPPPSSLGRKASDDGRNPQPARSLSVCLPASFALRRSANDHSYTAKKDTARLNIGHHCLSLPPLQPKQWLSGPAAEMITLPNLPFHHPSPHLFQGRGVRYMGTQSGDADAKADDAGRAQGQNKTGRDWAVPDKPRTGMTWQGRAGQDMAGQSSAGGRAKTPSNRRRGIGA